MHVPPGSSPGCLSIPAPRQHNATMEELAFTPVHELIHLIHTRQLSPREVVEAFLERIARLDPDLNAYLTVAEEEARRAAAEAEAAAARTDRLPLLSGIPVAVKDLEFTKGLRTTGGSLAYREFVPREDSVVVERLRRAGAIILGKTNTPEFGSYGQTWNRLSDDCRTPWDRSRTSGGSSGGSAAAVAAGLAPFATGTDGAGSIRAPAAFCGVYGFKPSFGRIPMHGGFLGLPLHTCPGPLARSVRDAAGHAVGAVRPRPTGSPTPRGKRRRILSVRLRVRCRLFALPGAPISGLRTSTPKSGAWPSRRRASSKRWVVTWRRRARPSTSTFSRLPTRCGTRTSTPPGDTCSRPVPTI